MGCDVHIHVEVKINDVWHHYQHLNCPRNYPVFALMGESYRKHIDDIPVKLPVGLPEDVSIITKLDYDRDNYHDASWFSHAEIRVFENRLMEELNVDFNDYCGEYLFDNAYGDKESLPSSITDVRFVFWFDN